jgi:hypothetical protein
MTSDNLNLSKFCTNFTTNVEKKKITKTRYCTLCTYTLKIKKIDDVFEIFFVGGDASTAKIKNVLAKLRHKEQSAELRLSKENLLNQLLVLIKENTVAIVAGGGKSSDPDPLASPAASQLPAQDPASPKAVKGTQADKGKAKEKDKDDELIPSDSSMPVPDQVQGPTSAPALLPASDSTPASPTATVPPKEHDWQVPGPWTQL